MSRTSYEYRRRLTSIPANYRGGSRVAFRHQLDDFAALYERSYQSVYRATFGICGDASLAADLTQDAFESAYRQQGRFRGDVPVEAWLYRIAVNVALSALRRQRVRWAEPFDPVRHDRQSHAGDPIDAVAIGAALAALNPRQRAVVVLRYYNDFDYATIAAILEISATNVGALLSRAVDRLRSELREHDAPRVDRVPASEEASRGR